MSKQAEFTTQIVSSRHDYSDRILIKSKHGCAQAGLSYVDSTWGEKTVKLWIKFDDPDLNPKEPGYWTFEPFTVSTLDKNHWIKCLKETQRRVEEFYGLMLRFKQREITRP